MWKVSRMPSSMYRSDAFGRTHRAEMKRALYHPMAGKAIARASHPSHKTQIH
jgi:hypothetical protein